MPIKLNHSCVSRCNSLIARGKIAHAAWDGESVERSEKNGSAFLGVDTDHPPDQVGHWKYPVVSGGEVNAKALGSAAAYAEKNGESAIAKATTELAGKVKKHADDGDGGKSFAIISRGPKGAPIVEGPQGYKMLEATARAIDAKRKAAPKGDEFNYRRIVKSNSEFSCDPGSRSDISTITTEAVDRDREVVLAQGIDLIDYNGAVMFAHDYKQPAVGRNLWIKSKAIGKVHGLIAKTQYAMRPKDWSGDGWLPDALLSLMQGEPPTCTGKSIGFMPLGYRSPTSQEVDARPELKSAAIIDKCSLMEYSVCAIPVNQEAEMLMVSKGFTASVRAILKAAAKDMDEYIEATEESDMPECPQCGDDEHVRRMKSDDDMYLCEKCDHVFNSMVPAKGIVKAFVADATVKAYAERKAMEQLEDLPERVAAKMIDRVYEMLGRA